MKLTTFLVALTVAGSSFAADLCKVLPSEYSEGTTTELYRKHFWDKPSFNKWEEKQVMAYINHEEDAEYYNADGDEVLLKNFDDVFNHFSDSSGYDELALAVMKDMKSGNVYTYVWSYPGDNEYGVFVNPYGKVVAEIQDGDLVVDGDYCP
jgi:hypothetical protein